MKAYKIFLDNFTPYSEIVFAESRGKAKYLALQYLDSCQDSTFTEIRVCRCPELDDKYYGKQILDWYDSIDRIFLVKEAHYVCEYPLAEDCLICSAKEFCNVETF